MDALSFLYKTVPGRLLLKPLASRLVSKLCGFFLDSRLSCPLINGFAKKNKINLDDYQLEGIKSFNEFFRRKIKNGLRPFDMEPSRLCAPCDGLLSVWEIQDKAVIPIKQSRYTIESLLQDKGLADKFDGGLCLVFRLCVDNYHRYCYADSGKKGPNVFIPGKLHTVRPIALESLPVFVENCREYTTIESPNFGLMVQMEVGAMLVGRIVNHQEEGAAVRGKEKGFFEYGGSTIIVLLQKDAAKIDEEFIKNSALAIESPVKMGQRVSQAVPQGQNSQK